MKTHVPSMLAKGIETINKHNKQPATMAYKTQHSDLEK